MTDSNPATSLLRSLPLSPPLPLPAGYTEAELVALIGAVEVENAPKAELANYWRQDWKRFAYTLGLTHDLTGSCLELGSNPYFTTTLLRHFTPLQLTLANYFGPQFGSEGEQKVTIRDPRTGSLERCTYRFAHFNVETDAFPFPNASFDVVLFCEVLEHLQTDPVKVLLEIKRVLKPNGRLITTTPNVSRLENVARMLAGANVYDPYSGYGPYGRHNREFNKDDLARLLRFCGFEIEELMSADVHPNVSDTFFPLVQLVPLVQSRESDLGQYLFSRSVNERPARSGRPAWLYRSYPAGELVAD